MNGIQSSNRFRNKRLSRTIYDFASKMKDLPL